METGKRKRSGDVADRVPPRRPVLPEEEPDDKLVTDNEVEEFFAILHRMHNARCLSASVRPPAAVSARDGGGGTTRWNPSFSWEDFSSAAPDAVGRGATEKKRPPSPLPPPPPVIRRAELIDLNAEPDTDPLAAASPRGEGTARCARAPA